MQGCGSSPSLFLKTLSEDDVVHVRGLGICLVSLAAGSPCPGYCMDTDVVINEINVRGGTGVGPPPVHLMVRGDASGQRSMNVWIGEWSFRGKVKLSKRQESPALTSGGWEPETGKCFLG